MEKIPGLPLDIYEMTNNMILTGAKLIFYHYNLTEGKYYQSESIPNKLNGETIKRIGQIQNIYYAITAKEVYVRGVCYNYSGLCTESFNYSSFTKFVKPANVTKITYTYYYPDTFILVD